jgi:hypothetical protein
MNINPLLRILLLPLVAVLIVSTDNALAASDKAPTPINFTYDLNLYNEFPWLNTDGSW